MNHSFMHGINAKKEGQSLTDNPNSAEGDSLYSHELWRQGWLFQEEQENGLEA